MPRPPVHVGLFVTCLVDFFRPSVGIAAARLLRAAGCTVSAPAAQTCCGQPAYNSGDEANAQALAKRMVDMFAPFDYVVAPSGSCAGMARVHFPKLLQNDPAYRDRARDLAARTYELVSFLTDVMEMDAAAPHATWRMRATYHDSCAGLREMGVKAQPRALLAGVEGLTVQEMGQAETCCGFGGTFCVKYPEIAARMAADKARAIHATGAEMVLAGDMGCLLHLAGALSRMGSPVACRHVAEILAGMDETPAIVGGGK